MAPLNTWMVWDWWLVTGSMGTSPFCFSSSNTEADYKWAGWLHNPCRLRGPHRFRAGGQNQKWPTSGPGGYITLAAWGSPPLQSSGQNQKWPTSGPCGYITLAAWGVHTASERRVESEEAHKWVGWLHNPCRLGGSPRLRAGGRISSGSLKRKILFFLVNFLLSKKINSFFH